jgi:hypothetical protein
MTERKKGYMFKMDKAKEEWVRHEDIKGFISLQKITCTSTESSHTEQSGIEPGPLW